MPTVTVFTAQRMLTIEQKADDASSKSIEAQADALAAKLSAEGSAFDAENSRLAAEAAEKNTLSPTEDVVRGVLGTEITTPGSQTNNAIDSAVADAESSIAPSNGKRAVGKGELFLDIRDYGAVADGVANPDGTVSGTVNTTFIQAALNESGATGNPVYMPKGIWLSGAITVPANAKIVADQATLLHHATSTPTFITMSSGSKIIGLIVDANFQVSSRAIYFLNIDNAYLDQCTVKNMTQSDLIAINGSTNIKIMNTICDTGFMGVHIYGASQYVQLWNVRVRNWEQRGIYTAADTTNAPKDIDLLYCRVTDLVSPSPHGATVREPIQFGGVSTNRIQRVRIIGCTVIGNGHAYTETIGPDGTAATAIQGTADQINASFIDTLTVAYCTSLYGGDCGFSGSGNINQSHVGNTAMYNDTAGIAVGGGAGGNTGVVISGNTCTSNHQNKFGDRQIGAGPGVYLYNAKHVVVNGNNLGDYQTTPTQSFGISAHVGCDDIRMSGNVFSGVTFNQLFNDDGTATNVETQDRLATSTPNFGTWVVGQRVRNTTPTVGQPKGWIVTTRGGSYSKTWQPSTQYNPGDWVQFTTNHIMLCLVGGVSNSGSQPVSSWGSVGGTLIDGTVTWCYMANATATFVSEGNL